MDRARIEAILEAAEKAVSTGAPVAPTGFWKAVTAAKRDPGLAEAHADRIARIDRAALKAWALVTVPLWLGNVLMIGGTAIGLAVVAGAYYLEGLASGLVFLLGFGIVLVTTHSLGHFVVGSLLGMRFTHWFIGPLRPPLPPGVKVDYSTYLRVPARSRAWMHASGAIVTKLMPFAFLGAALAAGVPIWVSWALILIGVAQIATDILWSTKASDWKKFRREMALAQRSS